MKWERSRIRYNDQVKGNIRGVTKNKKEEKNFKDKVKKKHVEVGGIKAIKNNEQNTLCGDH